MTGTGWFATVLLTLAAEPAAEVHRFEAIQRQMGVDFRIVLYAESDKAAENAFEAAYARIGELNSVMSDYDPDSELSRLSRASPTTQPVIVSNDLWHVLGQSQSLSRNTDGAFDVTVGPLSRLWRRARRQRQLPSKQRLDEARAAVGYRHIKLDGGKNRISLTRPNMRLDLGGIAKGYAADEALEVLRSMGHPNALVDGSGDLAIGDAPPDKAGWLIGVAPLEADAPPSRFVRLTNCAIATSGDVWQFVEIDGKRYSHILDPKTGLGLTRRSSVTVIAPHCTSADSLASAISVLGPKRGIDLINRLCKTEALFVYMSGDKQMVRPSNGFSKLTVDRPAPP